MPYSSFHGFSPRNAGAVTRRGSRETQREAAPRPPGDVGAIPAAAPGARAAQRSAEPDRGHRSRKITSRRRRRGTNLPAREELAPAREDPRAAHAREGLRRPVFRDLGGVSCGSGGVRVGLGGLRENRDPANWGNAACGRKGTRATGVGSSQAEDYGPRGASRCVRGRPGRQKGRAALARRSCRVCRTELSRAGSATPTSRHAGPATPTPRFSGRIRGTPARASQGEATGSARFR